MNKVIHISEHNAQRLEEYRHTGETLGACVIRILDAIERIEETRCKICGELVPEGHDSHCPYSI